MDGKRPDNPCGHYIYFGQFMSKDIEKTISGFAKRTESRKRKQGKAGGACIKALSSIRREILAFGRPEGKNLGAMGQSQDQDGELGEEER